MSEEGFLYGCIIGFGRSPDPQRNNYFRLNQTAIALLPDKDEWPPLTKGMFSVPVDERKGGLYRSQMIHLGASFNHFSEYWHLWLEKFGKLLLTMFWEQAFLHLETEYLGKQDYHWQANLDPVLADPPKPVSKWKFSGGTRESVKLSSPTPWWARLLGEP
jgi:hypothetical protein